MKLFAKILLTMLFLTILLVSCIERDRFGIGLERPEDANLYQREKRILRKLRAESFEGMKDRLENRIFYRVTADYTHKDRKTGEIETIKFNIVSMCGQNVFMDTKGYTVAESGGGATPAYFFEPTADDGLIMMRVPSACRSNQFPDERHIPDDLTPFVTWFDNVFKLTHGLGYASPYAYDSSISQLKFHGASIKRSNLNEWLTWRKERLKIFKPVGIVKSPWGVSLNGNDLEYKYLRNSERPRLSGFRACNGYRRKKLPLELKKQMQEIWPQGAPKFWIEKDAKLKSNSLYETFRKNKNYAGGKLWASDMVPNNHGILTRTGGGYLYAEPHRKKVLGEIYPKFNFNEDFSAASKKYRRPIVQHIDFRPEMRGFVSCGILIYNASTSAHSLGFDNGKGVYIGKKLLVQNGDFRPYNFGKNIMESDTHVWQPDF